MKSELGDVIVFKDDGRKKSGTVVSVNSDDTLSVEEHSTGEAKDKIRVPETEVIANMGEAPPIGSVYGRKIEPLLKEKDHEDWGKIQFYRHMSEIELTSLKTALKRSKKKLKELGLAERILPLSHLIIKAPKGRYAGMARVTRAGEFDVILHPKIFGNALEVSELIDHELGHIFQYRNMSVENMARWVEGYETFVKKFRVKENIVAKVVSAMCIHDGTISSFLSAQEDGSQESLAAQEITNWITSKYMLRWHDMELLHSLALSTKEPCLKRLCPTTELMYSTTEGSPITEYGMTSPAELFAECFRIHVNGGKLPKSLRKLMDNTLASE